MKSRFTRLRVGQEEQMFNGTVIDELMAAVARAEELAGADLQVVDEVLALPLPEYCGETALAGVA